MTLLEFLLENILDYISIENFYKNGSTSGIGAELLRAPHLRLYLDKEIEIVTRKGENKYLDWSIKIKQ